MADQSGYFARRILSPETKEKNKFDMSRIDGASRHQNAKIALVANITKTDPGRPGGAASLTAPAPLQAYQRFC